MRDGTRRLPRPRELPDDHTDVWQAVLIASGEDDSPDGPMGDFTPTLQRLHAMCIVDAEVGNGGFNQFFYNGRGPWIPRAVEGFEEAGLTDHRDVLRDVLGPAAAEDDLRAAAHQAGTLEAFARTYDETELDAFDDRWFELPSIYDSMNQYVRDHGASIWDD